ncbi:Uncharacterised protein [Chlamydia trachomatis]|nr:Uncharacterised protein [Chlamydia trachomatis]
MKWQIAECAGRLTPPPVLLKTKEEKVLTTGKKSNPIKDALFFHIRLVLYGNRIISEIPLLSFGIYQVEN